MKNRPLKTYNAQKNILIWKLENICIENFYKLNHKDCKL